jgi:hypothetical protein
MSDKERSPLRDKPLRLPGQSIQEERGRLLEDKLEPWLLMATFFIVLAGWEWMRVWLQLPPKPWLVTACAVLMLAFLAFRVIRLRPHLRALKQGMDGERAVGQFLERLREKGYHVFHDIVGTGFNLDHVLIGPAGVFAVETKTWSKPVKCDARVVCTGDGIRVAGQTPERSPIQQAKGASAWLKQLLAESTGRRIEVFPVVLFPGWFVEQDQVSRREVWVLEPKSLPAFLEREAIRLSAEEIAMSSFHLGRYVRSLERESDKARA